MMALVDKPKAGAGHGRRDPVATPVRYADDIYTWALQQSAFLKARDFASLDTDHLADEIMDVVHYLADKLRSDLARVIQHMLKWDHQPERRSRSWVLSIREHRRRIGRHLQEGPGLKGIVAASIAEAYVAGRNEVLIETDLPEKVLPAECPYSWDEIMTRPFDWPDPA